MAAIRLSRLPGVGAKRYRELLDQCGTPERALALMGGDDQDVADGKARLDHAVARVVAYCDRGGRGTYYGASDYPAPLHELTEPPPYLFRSGPLWPLDKRSIAIVGARDPSPEGRRFAFELAGAMAARGYTIISGGARGVDAAAHEGALAAGGRTVLVTATGIDRHYPPENTYLFGKMRERGLILTELLPGTPPRRDFFPTRNRIITGLSQALLVVCGRRRSGTYSSYRHMCKLARPIVVWSGARGENAEIVSMAKQEGVPDLADPDPDALEKMLTG
ncbi:MAG: DNA-processing protein DprA [Candidatus Lernaella stagnicola]|nr:DNA-processing protein DprA [Candidatus Lernaella stagnicola]